MTKMILCAAAVLAAGCATENHRVSSENGVPHYGLDDQPQKVAAGEGPSMRGTTDPRTIPTGQFTGRERTLDQIGQYPTLPREADARALDHDSMPPR